MPRHVVSILCGVFTVSLIVQGFFWFSPLSYADVHLWSEAARQISENVLPDVATTIPAHPGGTILIVGAVLLHAGISESSAVALAMVLLISGAIAVIAGICYSMRPRSVWWLGSAVLLSSPVYLSLTPPSALASLLVCVYVLILLRIRTLPASKRTFVLLGACAGVLLATRLDLGSICMVASIPLLYKNSLRHLATALFCAVAFFFILDPFMWTEPLVQVAAPFTQVGAVTALSLGFGYSLLVFTLAFISLGFGVVSVLFRNNFPQVMPRMYLMWLITVSVLFCAFFAASPYHPMRYFFPLIAVWEMFLPLFVFSLVENSGVNNKSALAYFFIALFVLARVAPGFIMFS